MTCAYLDHPDVIDETKAIRAAVAASLERREADTVSGFEKFFWVRATSAEGRVRFRPSVKSGPSTDDGYWICNLVLKGGGTLGLAHAGFVAGLESANIRFAGLAGASAGSIVALGIAAARGGDLLKRTTPDIVDVTASAPLDWFIDGPRPIRMLIKRCLLGRRMGSPAVLIGLFRAWRRLLSKRGLNQGDNFEFWLQSVMDRFGVATLDKLNDRLLDIRDTLLVANDDLGDELENRLVTYDGAPEDEREQASELLRLMSSAMPIGMKFELPSQMKYLDHDPATTSPARLARMSMAIPAFFDPVEMPVNSSTWQSASFLDHLAQLVPEGQANEFRALDRLTFLDGGVFANLPSDAFARNLCDIPTLVVPLVGRVETKKFMRKRRIRSLYDDAVGCAQAMRFQRDLDAYLQRAGHAEAFNERNAAQPVPKTFPMQISPIATGDTHWLNFVMSAGQKQDLFLAGVKAARQFIERMR